MANRNFASGGKLYSMHVSPVLIDMRFTVDNSAAPGITSLKGPTVANVYMHNSAVAASSINPVAGTIVVQLQDNYSRLLSYSASITSPNSGSDIKVDNSALTVGTAYTITTLGNSTAAQWATLGVPPGITPAVGVSFIAALVGIAGEANTSTSKVQIATTTGSGVASIEMVPQASADIAPDQSMQSYGAQFIFQCRDYAGALVAPAAGSIISIQLLLSNSSVTIQGE